MKHFFAFGKVSKPADPIKGHRLRCVASLLTSLIVVAITSFGLASNAFPPGSLPADAPALTWNTFLGEANGPTVDAGQAIAVDNIGNLYLAGKSNYGWGSPVRPHSGAGKDDAFILKLDATGNPLWLTFLGGTEADEAVGLAVDGSGQVVVTGISAGSWGNPLRAFTNTPYAVTDAFVAKLGSDGTLLWNTFLGENGEDKAVGIVVDSSGAIWAAGTSQQSWGAPVLIFEGDHDAFVAKLDSSGTLLWNSFIGGRGGGIAKAGNGDVLVCGQSTHPHQMIFAARLDAAGNLLWITRLGGYSTDGANGIGLDDSGNVYLAGYSSGAFAAKLTGQGSLVWTRALGGNGTALGIAVDGSGTVTVQGRSSEAWGSPIRPFTVGHGGDQFAARLDNDGNLLWNTFLGGVGDEQGGGITVGATGTVYVSGTSWSSWGTPIRAYSRQGDAFIACLGGTGTLVWNLFIGGSTAPSPNQVLGVAADAAGHVNVVGNSYTSWGNPIEPADLNWFNAFVAQYDGSGSLIWNTFLAQSDGSAIAAIAVDSSGCIYVTGTAIDSWGTPMRDFSGTTDALVAKLAADGHRLWHTFLGGPRKDIGNAIAVDDSGNVYVAGTQNIRVYPSEHDTEDVFVAKLSSDGTLIWNTILGGNMSDYCPDIALAADGTIYVTGSSMGPWGTPLRAYSGGGDIFVARLDPEGNLLWNMFLGGTAWDIGSSLTLTRDGHLVVCGYSKGSWGYPLEPLPAGGSGTVLTMLGEDGSIGWNTFLNLAQPIPSLVQNPLKITSDKAGNLYLTGTIPMPSKSVSQAMQNNAFVARLNDNGRLVWNLSLGSTALDLGTDLDLDEAGNLYFTGYSYALWGSPLHAAMDSGGGFLAKIPASPLGDMNIDGAVNALDLLMMAEFLAGATSVLPSGEAGADVNGDDRLDSLDLLWEAQTVLGN